MIRIRIVHLLIIAIGFLFSVQTVEARVTTFPSSITIPRGIQTARTITYNIRTSVTCTQAFSTSGEFISGGNILGVINKRLSVTLIRDPSTVSGSTGSANETVVVPVGVIKRAEALNVNRFQYRRMFDYTCAGLPSYIAGETGSVQIGVTSEATAEFGITRLQLYFENRRAEITVKRNQPSLRAFVDIRFTGSGLLQGYWEVDGRILSYVNQDLVYGRSVTIESPEIPALPTFVTGSHIVKFVITSPSLDLPLPEAIYFVTAEEFRERLDIRLTSPKDKSEADYAPLTFEWEGKEEAVTYLIEFLEGTGEKPIFSAYTKRSNYNLPEPVLKSLFSMGKSYLWRVKGFNADNNIVGESSTFRFTFKELSSYLPGRIVGAEEGSQRRIGLIEGLYTETQREWTH